MDGINGPGQSSSLDIESLNSLLGDPDREPIDDSMMISVYNSELPNEFGQVSFPDDFIAGEELNESPLKDLVGDPWLTEDLGSAFHINSIKQNLQGATIVGPPTLAGDFVIDQALVKQIAAAESPHSSNDVYLHDHDYDSYRGRSDGGSSASCSSDENSNSSHSGSDSNGFSESNSNCNEESNALTFNPQPLADISSNKQQVKDKLHGEKSKVERSIPSHLTATRKPQSSLCPTKRKAMRDASVSSSSESSTPKSSPKATGRKPRSRRITNLTLTEEEKQLLAKEGYPVFPVSKSFPLTKHEERILRKVRRKIRNKRSAQCSRQRKKEYMEDLEKKYTIKTAENEKLKKEVHRLKSENQSLVIKLKKLLGNLQGEDRVSFKTSLFVLVLSFMLVVFPYFRYVNLGRAP